MTWSEILARVKALDDRFRVDGSAAWFRGHRRAEWRLESSLHRHVEAYVKKYEERPPEVDVAEFLRDEYKMIFRAFERDAYLLLDESERSPWGMVFAMQHFGLPTRVLDWTESFACAAFFAHLHREPHDSATIWVLDPQALNRLSIGRDDLVAGGDPSAKRQPTNVDPDAWLPARHPETALPTISFVPVLTNRRMVAQRSVFTLAGDSLIPLEDQPLGKQLQATERLAKIELPPATFDEVQQYLDGAGITAFNYFPDLEGLALKHRARTERTLRDAKRLYPEGFRDEKT